jgi:hypothetical protein
MDDLVGKEASIEVMLYSSIESNDDPHYCPKVKNVG